MSDKINLIDDEIPTYKKKSKKKGQPRADHKHTYETVLLVRHYEVPDIHTGKQIAKESRLPTKVCTICGRIDETDTDEKWYQKTEHKHLKWTYFTKDLSEDALKLPVWFCTGYFDKFATKMEG